MGARTSTWVGAGFACATAGLALHAALTTVADPRVIEPIRVEWLYLSLIVFATLACLARWRSQPTDRSAWACLSVALLSWTAGEAYHLAFLADEAITPFPSPSDGFFVLFYPLCFAAVCLRVAGSVGRISATLLLDGFIAATAACAVLAPLTLAATLPGIAESAGLLAVIFELAYPVGDLILVGAVVGGASLVRERIGRELAAIGAGLVLVATADAIFLSQTLAGTYVEGSWFESLWPAGLLLIAWSGWGCAHAQRERRPAGDSWLPVAFSLLAVGVLAVAGFSDVDRVSQALATMAALGVVARMNLALRDNRRLLEASRREALVDPLTGLGNRRELVQRLEAAVGAGTAHHLFVFDLDGFKLFNDTFGHPAGDDLLVRRGRSLTQGLGAGASAFRLGGDEFCLLVEDRVSDPWAALAAAESALCERGAGYEIRASWGGVAIPGEAGGAAEAMLLADRRMYARKKQRKSRSGRDGTAVAA